MSPRSATLLALIGVLLAGIPLPALTGARSKAPAASAEEAARPRSSAPEAPQRRVYATLQCSGQPTGFSLLHEGRELARLGAAELEGGLWEVELSLPAASMITLELQAHWSEGSEPQAATITLEPDGLPTQSCTRWTEPGSDTLHALFSFSW